MCEFVGGNKHITQAALINRPPVEQPVSSTCENINFHVVISLPPVRAHPNTPTRRPHTSYGINIHQLVWIKLQQTGKKAKIVEF